MSWVVIITDLRGGEDFEVVGAFVDKADAVAYAQAAFFNPRYEHCLTRVKEMRSAEEAEAKQ